MRFLMSSEEAFGKEEPVGHSTYGLHISRFEVLSRNKGMGPRRVVRRG